MRTIWFSVFVLFFTVNVNAQMTLNSSSVSENFDGMGSSSTASLPSGFKVDQGTNYSNGVTSTSQAAGTTGVGIVTSTSTGGTYNWANGVTASSTDRALGFLNSGSFESPRSIMLQILNNTNTTITSIKVDFDFEKYRSGSRAWNWTFYYSHDGSTWTERSEGNQSYPADDNNSTVSNPPSTTSKSITISSSLSILNNGSIYLRWTLTGSGGTTNGQGIGIDNLVINVLSPLPISLLSFNSSTERDAILLHWQTASELNNDYFSVERSGNGKSFVSIATVPGNGTSTSTRNYSYRDNSPIHGINYYRLKQVDYDGTYTFSKIITAVFGEEGEFSMFPTQVSNEINLTLPDRLEENVRAEVFDQLGRRHQSWLLDGGLTKHTLDASRLNSGVYFLRVQTRGTQKVMRYVKL